MRLSLHRLDVSTVFRKPVQNITGCVYSWAGTQLVFRIWTSFADMSQKIIVTITKTSLFKYTENFTTKKWKFSDKNSDIFHISAQNIDCGYSLELPQWGSSNEYPQSMFLSRNKNNNVYPCKPQFYDIKVGFKRVNIYIDMFSWCVIRHKHFL